MSAPWAPPPRPERPRSLRIGVTAEEFAAAMARLQAVLERIGAAEAVQAELERRAEDERRRLRCQFALMFVAGLLLALMLL